MASSYPGSSTKLTLGDGTTYAYVCIPPSIPRKPTFLLLHGFPSSSYEWRHQIPFLSFLGYGVIAPDLLGYGNSDAPGELEAYEFKRMANHLAEILAYEKLEKVIGVGHDWGSGLLSRFNTWHSDKLLAAVWVATGYAEPGTEPMDIDAINAFTTDRFGHPAMGYWKLFDKPEAGRILDEKPERITSILYPPSPELWKENLGPVGALEKWLNSDNILPSLPGWLGDEEFKKHNKIMKIKGYHGPCNWYKSAIANIDAVHHMGLPEERKYVTVPALLVVPTDDTFFPPEILMMGSQWYRNLRVEEISAAHWAQLEAPDKLNELLASFTKGLESPCVSDCEI
ncbi:hypothetical protein HYFRA_00010733 [Hymenoscyphus fraxineus]|uniref:AB hydrolase-1 domain-containing protein n=1 Tax=Hymenoscyphus fraxineus TaxID=746836 RepID=A0A9N9KZH3_9HELO|nr:hypothetical protein HYFRA_00010733 [Hymenoscyphus fraxineus]